MPQATQSLKRKRSIRVAPVLGAAGWLTLASGASAEALVDMPTPNAEASHRVILGVEEIDDVSLAKFHVLDKENRDAFRPGVRFAVGAGGGCWTGTYYTSSGSGNDAYPPPHPTRASGTHAPKRGPKN
jgi:hypothetical protein